MKKCLVLIFAAVVCGIFVGCDSTPPCPVCNTPPPVHDTIVDFDTVYVIDNDAIETVEDLLVFAGAVNDGNNFAGVKIRLANDLDLSAIPNWTPIGTEDNRFSGIFDGQEHTISGLTIDAPSNDNLGLFGVIDKAKITNLNISDAEVLGHNQIASLVGRSWSSVIENCSAKDVLITGNTIVGGLFGAINTGSNASKCFADGAIVNTQNHVGGGLGGGVSNGSNLSNSYAVNCVVSGGNDNFGVLVGDVGESQIDNSYAAGGSVSNTNPEQVGGLAYISNSSNNARISNSYHSTTVNGHPDGLELSAMQEQATFVGWDFEGIWKISPEKNGGFPTLKQ